MWFLIRWLRTWVIRGSQWRYCLGNSGWSWSCKPSIVLRGLLLMMPWCCGSSNEVLLLLITFSSRKIELPLDLCTNGIRLLRGMRRTHLKRSKAKWCSGKLTIDPWIRNRFPCIWSSRQSLASPFFIPTTRWAFRAKRPILVPCRVGIIVSI